MKEEVRRKRNQVIREYDRLVAKEREENPIRAMFLPKWYYVKMIANNPEFDYTERSIYQFIKLRYSDKC